MELPDSNVVVSKRICECYRELGVKMEQYNKGQGIWG